MDALDRAEVAGPRLGSIWLGVSQPQSFRAGAWFRTPRGEGPGLRSERLRYAQNRLGQKHPRSLYRVEMACKLLG